MKWVVNFDELTGDGSTTHVGCGGRIVLARVNDTPAIYCMRCKEYELNKGGEWHCRTYTPIPIPDDIRAGKKQRKRRNGKVH